MRNSPVGAEHGRLNRHRFAAGRVQGKARAVDVDPQVAQGQGDPLEDLGKRVALDRDPSAFAVNIDAGARDDGPELKGPGLGRDDNHDRERHHYEKGPTR